MRTVQINREPVELYKILNFEGLAASGGEAKLLIGDGRIMNTPGYILEECATLARQYSLPSIDKASCIHVRRTRNSTRS